jgi:hypothetical protein
VISFPRLLRAISIPGIALCAVLAGGAAVAGSPGDPPATRVPKPVLETGKGDKCVEDTEFMRRNHMNLLKHQRDDTVHRGVRTERYSLNHCIECHAGGKNNRVVGTDRNFCQSCHTYVAVSLDCFECHASKPKVAGAAPAARAGSVAASSERAALRID